MLNSLIQSQRTMRNQRENALRRGCVAIIDIGSDKVFCQVLRVDLEELRKPRPDGVGHMDGHQGLEAAGAHHIQSRGIERGVITSMEEVERAVMTTLQVAQQRAKTRVDHVIVLVSGGTPKSYGLLGEAEVEYIEVQEGDIGQAMANAPLPDYGEDREILHAQPVNFTLDHRTGLTNPLGMSGTRLAVDMHMLTVDADLMRNLVACMRHSGLELSGVMHTAYTAGISTLFEDELRLGAACIDIGAETTGVSIFLKDQLIFADSVPLGGADITSDICHALQTSFAQAERIKVRDGGLVHTGRDDRHMIPLSRSDQDYDRARHQISRTELIGVIRPRVEEILDQVRERLEAAGFDHLPGRHIVLTGGSSQIPGLADLAVTRLGGNVRIGRPLRLPQMPKAHVAGQFAAATGAALHLANPQDECWDFEIPSERSGSQRLRRAFKWFRDNW